MFWTQRQTNGYVTNRLSKTLLTRVNHALGSKTDGRVGDKQINPVNKGKPCPGLKNRRKGR